MKSDWDNTTIAECAADEPYSTQIGPFGNKIKSEIYTESGAPVLRGVNVNKGRFYDEDYVFVSEDYADEELSKFEAKANDVLLVHKGSLGQIGIIPEQSKYERYIMGNSMMKVKCNPEKVLPKFLYYWLSSSFGTAYLLSRVSQVGVPQIQRPLSTLREAEFSKPSIAEQEAIVELLDSLDSKIELNHRINRTLEAMAQAIFKSWFVDFDPVKAKLAAMQHGRDPEKTAMAAISGKLSIPPGKPKPDLLDSQLPSVEVIEAAIEALEELSDEQWEKLAETAGHFPGGFEESELGLVPEGWEVCSFDKIVKLETKSVKPYNEADKKWEHYSIPAYDESQFPAFDFGKNIKSNKYQVNPSSILASKLNPQFPRTWWPFVFNKNCAICSTEFMQFVPRCAEEQSFLYCLITSDPFQNAIQLRVTGSTGSRQRAKPKEIATMDCLIVPKLLRLLFAKQVDPIFGKINTNKIQSITLAELRDTLLPKLLSGELPVSAASNTVETAIKS